MYGQSVKHFYARPNFYDPNIDRNSFCSNIQIIVHYIYKNEVLQLFPIKLDSMFEYMNI